MTSEVIYRIVESGALHRHQMEEARNVFEGGPNLRENSIWDRVLLPMTESIQQGSMSALKKSNEV